MSIFKTMQADFHLFLSKYIRIDESSMQQLLEQCEDVHFKKGAYFVREGELCHKIGFLISGIARVYHIANDKEYTSYFNFPGRNRMVASFESFLSRKPSKETIHFLEDAHLVVISREKLYQLYQLSPVFSELGRKLAEDNYILAMERIFSLQHDTAQERYLKLLESYPDLMNFVPHHYVASYLGITPESLSRIRKELMQ
jgi:CRP-like cAMP-binding protein